MSARSKAEWRKRNAERNRAIQRKAQERYRGTVKGLLSEMRAKAKQRRQV